MFGIEKNLLKFIKPLFGKQAAKNHWLCISDEVKTALSEKRGVVALESTVITHGMPFPDNLRVAKELEAIIRQHDCIPATVALLNGKVHVGLDDNQLDLLAHCKSAQKVSRRDLAATLVRKGVGSTTVSATMIAAHAAGISIFATGGIGGVHRGVNDTFDVSADLTELGRTPVTVVCAGVKSILDVPKTLEYLETEGVPVIAFSESNDFPGFFSKCSGCKSPFNFTNEQEIASIINISQELNLQNGNLVAVPIPKTEENAGDKIESAINEALIESKNLNISGRDITPFVLKRVNELTKGLSLKLNSILIKNNAIHAAKIANALSKIKMNKSLSGKAMTKSHASSADVVVIGGTIVDFYVQTDQEVHSDGRTIPGKITQVCGGVGRNHADALSRLGTKTVLISAAGDDALKLYLQNCCSHIDLRAMKWVKNERTASYAGITSRGVLSFGIGSMDIFNHIDTNTINEFREMIQRCKLCVIDGNPPVKTISLVCEICSDANVAVWFDPADCSKVEKIIEANSWQKVNYFSPNWNEFVALSRHMEMDYAETLLKNKKRLYERLINDAKKILIGASKTILLTMGQDGVIVLAKLRENCSIIHFASPLVSNVTNVSGAGDCFNSGFIHGLLRGRSQMESVQMGLRCANISLHSVHAVPEELTSVNFSDLETPKILFAHEFLL